MQSPTNCLDGLYLLAMQMSPFVCDDQKKESIDEMLSHLFLLRKIHRTLLASTTAEHQSLVTKLPSEVC